MNEDAGLRVLASRLRGVGSIGAGEGEEATPLFPLCMWGDEDIGLSLEEDECTVADNGTILSVANVGDKLVEEEF